MWTLTYSVHGNKHVEVIPHDQVAQLKTLVQQYREHRDALKELGAINAQLLHLWRLEQRSRERKPNKKSDKLNTTRRKFRRRRSKSSK